MLEYKHDDWNGVFGNVQILLLSRGDTLTTITTLLRQEISCQLNLFLPTKLAVYFFNPFLKASERLASIRSPLQIFTVHFFVS